MQAIWKAQSDAQDRAIAVKENRDYRSFMNRPLPKNANDIKPGHVVYWLKPNANAGHGTLGQRFYGPYKVLDADQRGAVLQHIDTGIRESNRVNIEHLKPVQVNPDYFNRPHFSTDNTYHSRPNKNATKPMMTSEE